jgi:hypothetical protein
MDRRVCVYMCVSVQVMQGEYVHFSVGNNAARSTMQQGGSVAFVWRGHLFLKSTEFMDTGGFTCVRANKCKVCPLRVALVSCLDSTCVHTLTPRLC